MAKKKLESTKIKKSITHDRMSINPTFPNGGILKYSISRSGERLSIGFTKDYDDELVGEQLKTIAKWLKLGKDEINLQRFARLEELMMSCKTGEELVEKIK